MKFIFIQHHTQNTVKIYAETLEEARKQLPVTKDFETYTLKSFTFGGK